MGRELIDSYPVFKASLQEAEWHLKAIGAEWSLLEELQRSEKTSRINTTALSIPICVALQISLVRLCDCLSCGVSRRQLSQAIRLVRSRQHTLPER